jgi:hypothetical protein
MCIMVHFRGGGNPNVGGWDRPGENPLPPPPFFFWVGGHFLGGEGDNTPTPSGLNAHFCKEYNNFNSLHLLGTTFILLNDKRVISQKLLHFCTFVLSINVVEWSINPPR